MRAGRLSLQRIDGPPIGHDELLARGRVTLLFAHADCPTSVLALRRLGAARADGAALVCVAQETPEAAARLARRTGVAFTVLAEDSPYPVSRAHGVDAVPTAVVLERGEEIERVVGWDAAAYERLLGVQLPGEPRSKPGCGARWMYDYGARGGLDELEDMFERGWSDGLPVIPPTRERVEAMLGGRDRTDSLGFIPPGHGEATLERVAACAVLAGCKPAYFPLVVAAVEAALDPAFNAHGIAVTTQPAGPIVIVNGPARERVGLNSGMGVLGPGARANMTLGRALRLVLTLTGGALPGALDRSTLGNPAKLGLCLAENEEASPWEPLHVERGFAPDASTVTVFAADAPLSVSDHRSLTADELAYVLATAAGATWSPFWWPMDYQSLFVVCPEHAALFRAAGWTKARLREAIFEHAVRPARELNRGETTPYVKAADPEDRVHKWTDADRILIVVAGGEAGRFSAVFGPCGGMGETAITKEVRWTT